MAKINLSCTNLIMSTEQPFNCIHSSRITKLETQYNLLTPLVNKIDMKLDQVILGLGRMEVLEIKHNTHAEALDRAFNRIEATEKQLVETTRIVQDMLSQVKGMARVAIVLWAICGATITFILNKVI